MYSTSAMLGLNHRVRNVPVSSRITKLHSAISPSMKDQWSGNTLRSCFFAIPATPVRSSIHLTGPGRVRLAGLPSPLAVVALMSRSPPFPETRSNRFVEVAHRNQVSLVVKAERQLRQRTSSRPEEDLGVVGQVERRLVART